MTALQPRPASLTATPSSRPATRGSSRGASGLCFRRRTSGHSENRRGGSRLWVRAGSAEDLRVWVESQGGDVTAVRVGDGDRGRGLFAARAISKVRSFRFSHFYFW